MSAPSACARAEPMPSMHQPEAKEETSDADAPSTRVAASSTAADEAATMHPARPPIDARSISAYLATLSPDARIELLAHAHALPNDEHADSTPRTPSSRSTPPAIVPSSAPVSLDETINS
jgi:hypothetical protein